MSSSPNDLNGSSNRSLQTSGIGRRIAMAFLVLAVSLPLVIIVTWMRMESRSNGPEEQDKNIIPVLPQEVRRTLPTFARDCKRDTDCDPPLGCFIKGSTGLHRCFDSDCETDAQCEANESCVPLKLDSGKAMVRLCSLVGERKEGELCEILPLVPEDACTRGLLCQGRCGRPCQLGDAGSCPEGSFCVEGREGPPSCLPTCEGRACPDGLTCMPRGQKKASLCARMAGPDCRVDACEAQHRCRILEPPGRPWDLRTECRRMCDYRTPCPEGFFCRHFGCMKSCAPQEPNTCGPGLVCGHHHPNEPWYCIPG